MKTEALINAVKNTKERLEDFYRGGTMRPHDEGAVAQCIGAFAVLLDELEMLQKQEASK